MKEIERIKMDMKDNLRDFIEYQNSQLKAFEEFLNTDDLDELDIKLQDFDEDYKYHNSILKDIVFRQNELIEEIKTVSWRVKEKELGGNVNAN